MPKLDIMRPMCGEALFGMDVEFLLFSPLGYQDQLPLNLLRSISNPVTIVRVSDFIVDGNWNVDLLNSVFWLVDVEEILNIPRCRNRTEDLLVWRYDSRGLYTVCSGYWLLEVLLGLQKPQELLEMLNGGGGFGT